MKRKSKKVSILQYQLNKQWQGCYLIYCFCKSFINIIIFGCNTIMVKPRHSSGNSVTIKKKSHLWLSTYLPTCQPTYLPIYPPTYLTTCQPAYLPEYLPTCLATCQHTYLPIYIATCLSIYLSTYLPDCLPFYLLAFLLTYLPICLPANLPTVHSCVLEE